MLSSQGWWVGVTIFELLSTVVGLVGVIVLAQLVVGNPMIGVALCLAPATWIYGGRWDLTLGQVADFNVYASDLIAVVLVLAALMRPGKLGGRGWTWAWGGIIALLGLAVVQGIAVFGTSAAINEARTSIYLVAAVSWSLTTDWVNQDLVKAGLVFGWIFVALATVHLLLYGFGTVDYEGRTAEDAKRILNSTQALVLALCASAVFFENDRKRRFVVRFSAVVFTVVIIAAQNRSVWIAIIGGFIAVFVLGTDAGRRQRASGALMLLGLGAVFVFIDPMGDSVTSKLTTAGTATGSLGWRVQSWQQLLESWLNLGLVQMAVGEPFGGGVARLVDGRVTEVSAHSWYVELMLRTGAVGTLLWVSLLVRGTLRARRANTTALFCGAALLCFSAFYVLPWNVAPWVGILLIAGGITQGSPVSSLGHARRPARHRSDSKPQRLPRRPGRRWGEYHVRNPPRPVVSAS